MYGGVILSERMIDERAARGAQAITTNWAEPRMVFRVKGCGMRLAYAAEGAGGRHPRRVWKSHPSIGVMP